MREGFPSGTHDFGRRAPGDVVDHRIAKRPDAADVGRSGIGAARPDRRGEQHRPLRRPDRAEHHVEGVVEQQPQLLRDWPSSVTVET